MLRQIKHKIGNYLPALRSPNYRLYFVGQGISLVGTWIQNVAEAWLIYPILTGQQALLGIISAINLAPHFLLVLFAGVIVDRLPRRKALIFQQLLYASLAFTMFLLVYTKTVQVWHVMTIAFCFGIVFAFEMPTRQSLMMNLVKKKDYPSAISLNAAIYNIARSIGPALAGISIATIGISPAYLINSLSFLAVIVAVILMRLPREIRPTGSIDFRAGFRESFTFFKLNNIIVILLGILLLVTLFTWPLATLLPVFAKDVFHKGELGFGLLQTAFGIGALIGALCFSKLFSAVHDKAKLLKISFLTQFLAILFFSLSPWFIGALVAQVVNGLVTQTVISSCNTLIQLATPDNLRGRMLSFYSFVLVGGMPFGALLGSLGIATVGPRSTVGICAIAYLAAIWLLINFRKNYFQAELKEMV